MNLKTEISHKRKVIFLAVFIALIAVAFPMFLYAGSIYKKPVALTSELNPATGLDNTFSEVKAVEDQKPDIKVSVVSGENISPDTKNTEKSLNNEKIDTDCMPSSFKYSWEIFRENNLVSDFTRDLPVSFGDAAKYSDIAGVLTFRGNNYRNGAAYGFADIRQQKLEKVWFSKTGYIDTWTGVGWNGQPAIVRWDDKVKRQMNIYPLKKSVNDLKEVIYAALDGKIYFLDLMDGKETRTPIKTGYPYKGSVSVDPRGYPLLYAGQGINEIEGKPVPIGYRIFNLLDQRQIYFIDGYDSKALRGWGAFDSVALFDKAADTLIECGENGIIYTVKLNTDYSLEKRSLKIRPEVIKFRYNSPLGNKIGCESSPVIYGSLIYSTDNSGLLQCIDLNTMKPVWLRDVSDDSDSSPALEVSENGGVWLYTASEVDKLGRDGYSHIRKINALTGKLLWERSVKCYYDSNTNGGVLASPVIGKNEISNLVIYNIAKTMEDTGENASDSKNLGRLIAFDKTTGKEVWSVKMDHYSWSSPVDLYTPEGKAYLIVCDSGGFMRLLEGSTGRELDKIPLEANIEGSPAIYNDMIVVGTRGQKIWGIRIK